MERKSYYNKNGVDSLEETLLKNGKENKGFRDFNRPRYSWSKKILDNMLADTWFPGEVNTSGEKLALSNATDNEKNIYEKVFAQLSINDAIQEDHLADFRAKVNNNIVKSTITIQQAQETNHSQSYSVLLDSAGNADAVREADKLYVPLSLKNQKIKVFIIQI